MACRDHFGDEILLSMLEAPEAIWPAARVEVCLRPLLRAVRIGPFVSTPELGWRSILTGPLLGVLADGDRIVSNTNQPVLEDGTPIGYPPLHNHHVHVRKDDALRNMRRTINNHWFESHGDYTDGPSYGIGAASTDGYATAVPAGYCIVVNEAEGIDVEAEVNDVRVRTPELADPPIRWYLQLAFVLTNAPCRPASKAWFRFTTSVTYPDDWWIRYDVPNQPALTWWTGEMPTAGTLLHTWHHSHRLRYGELLLLASSLPELGFSCSRYGITAVRGDYALAKNLTWTRDELVRRGRVVCRTDPASPSAVQIGASAREGVAAGRYDRRGGLRCSAWRFEKGAPWTIVALHAPRWDATTAHVKQHSELWMYLDEGSDRSESYLPDWGADAMNCQEEGVETAARGGGGGGGGDGDGDGERPWWLSLVPGVHPAGFLQLSEAADEPASRRRGVSHLVTVLGGAATLATAALVVAARRTHRNRRRREYSELSGCG